MVSPQQADGPTAVVAHNLLLRKGPSFRVYVRWLRGTMPRARANLNPSFDDPESFYLDIQTGVLRANLGDIGTFLNSGGLGQSPLKNVLVRGDGDQMRITGTLHKIISLPIEVRGTISATKDNRIQIHVDKINVLKIPFKALLGDFHITVASLFPTKGLTGIEVKGNDIYLDTRTLLPPPHIQGRLTNVHIVNPDLEEVFGDGKIGETRAEQWRNFLRLKGGTLDIGKLTMHDVDLIMVDISKDAWFNLDLANYQKQLVNGYTHITPEAGLQIFMPDLRDIPPSRVPKDLDMQWMRNRNVPPPASITSK